MQRKHGLIFYGIILSAIHFTAAALLSKVVPLLMLRPEDMIGSAGKPHWPPSRLRDSIEHVGDVLSQPANWVYDSWPGMPDFLAILLFIFSSCLWGFTLALLLRFLFKRLRPSHETYPG